MMFFLWCKILFFRISIFNNKLYKSLTNNKKGATRKIKIKTNPFAVKRMSFYLIDNKMGQGSMTIEAALVVPFFLFAIVNLISIIEIYRLQGNMSAIMHQTAKQMAIYGYEYNQISGQPDKAQSLGMTYLYAANNVKKGLGSEYFDASPVKGGFSGISWIRSKVMEKNDCIDLIADYAVESPFGIIGFDDVSMYNRIRTRAWTGYDIYNIPQNDEELQQLVYITPEGVVYHMSRGCTYLKYSIVAADRDLLKNQRNEDGSIYYPCESCGDSNGQTVFITSYGTRYHSTLACNKLRRTVQAVPISEVGDRGACSKCCVY